MSDNPIESFIYPVKNGEFAPSCRLKPVLNHTFSDYPRWSQGVIAQDVKEDSASKQYLTVCDMEGTFSDIMEWKEDFHTYEVLPESRPVRPYFDLDWDAGLLGEEDTLHLVLCVISEALKQVGVQGRGISIYSASGPNHKMASGKKASYHLICDTDLVFHNTVQHKQFIETILLPLIRSNPVWVEQLTYINVKGQPNLVIDTIPYTRNQLFRMPYQSKWSSSSSRPLILYQSERTLDAGLFYVGLYCDPAELSFISLPEQGQVCKVADVCHDAALLKGVLSPEWNKVVALTELLTTAFVYDYTKARDLIWCLWSVEQTARMREVVHRVCARAANYEHRWVESIVRAWKFGGFTVGSLIKWATDCSDAASVSALVTQHVVHYKMELFSETMKPVEHRQVHQRYLETLPDTVDTLLLKSHLGTGKTQQIIKLLQGLAATDRVLIVSPRKSYTTSLHGELQRVSGLETFESYLDHSYGGLTHLPRIIIQVESLHRVGLGFCKYDMVILDEVESILHQLHSVKTNGCHSISNHEVLGLAVSTATRVIMADAFLSDRTFYMSRCLRSNNALYLENTYQPYQREAIFLSPIAGDRRAANLGAFCERICAALRGGKKIVVLWTSKRRGEWFVQHHLDTWGDNTPLWVFYNSATSKEEQAGLQDVKERWSTVQCLMMTTSITVGISYDPKVAEIEFDEAFLYGSSASAMPRDIAQGLLRVRVLKANRLTYVMDTRVCGGGVKGMQQVQQLLTAKEERHMRDHPLVRWKTCPEWARYNHAYNENEVRISRSEYAEVLREYLVWSGYTLKEMVHIPTEALMQSIATLEGGDSVEWNEVDDIDSEVAEDILVRMKRGEAGVDEQWMYKKWVFRRQFTHDTTEEMRGGWWERFYVKGHEAAFWNIVLEKQRTVTDVVRREAVYRYSVMATDAITKRETVGRFLKMVGMTHSQESVTWNAEKLEAVGITLKEAERELREGMGLRKSERKGEWSVATTIDIVRAVLEAWGRCTVETSFIQIKEDGKKIRKYCLKINESNTIWDAIHGTTTNYDQNLIIL